MIHMIRHGQACFGHDDYDRLSPLGVRQVRILARHLLDAQFRPDAVYSGTLVRQAATAQEVLSAYRAAGRDLPPLELMSGLNEFDTGAVITAMFPDMVRGDPTLEDHLPKMYASKDSFKRIFEAAMLRWVSAPVDPPGVESWTSFRDRVSTCLRSIIARHKTGKCIAVFTSGGPIAASLSHVLGISGDQAMWLNWQIVNTSVTRYMYHEERITLAGFNSIAHLELAGDPTLITYR
jgi:broad specificity phosphatase PhoE